MKNLALYREYEMLRSGNHSYGINTIYYASVIEQRNNFRSGVHILIYGNLNKLRSIIKFFVDNDYIF